MKTTAIICTNAALILIGLMTCPKLVATIGMMIAIIIMVACCFAPFFITHPACSPEDNLPSQPAKTDVSKSAS